MTTTADLSSSASGKGQRPASQTSAEPTAPSAIHMTMPEPVSESATGTPGDPQQRVEALLYKLMERVEENDRRYSQALDNLYDSLNTISGQPHSSETSSLSATGAAVDRVREQASSLAARVQDAGAAHKALHGTGQRLDTYDGRLEGGHSLGAGAGLDANFEGLAKRLECSLANHSPVNEFDMLAQRMDELADRFDTVLAARDEPGRLLSIEAQLKQITTAFANAQQHYTRIDAIEDHLVSLVKWTQSANAPGKGGEPRQRLDAMNDGLDTLAARIESSPASTDGIENTPPPNGGGVSHKAEDYAEVFIDKGPKSQSGDPPAPILPGEPGITRPGAGQDTPRARQHERVEPTVDADSDWVASARRAAAAAAQASRPAPARPRGARTRAVPQEAAPSTASGSKRPRPAFVAAAVCLLLISAGILLVRLRTSPDTPAIGILQQEAPKPPVAAPKAPANGKDDKKRHSERKLTGQPQPSARKRAAPLASPPAAPATRTRTRATAPDRTVQLGVQPRQSISTATVLAALAPKAAPEEFSGVEMSVTGPPAHAPAPRVSATPPTAAPALVPLSSVTPRPGPLPLPKRMGTAGKTGSKTGAKPSIPGNASASETPLPMPSRQAAMPPARIGPQSLRMAAARGNPAAQTEVASRFAKGTGVAKNLKKAAQWYGRAAAQSFAPAQYRLAALHERGMGVKQDIALARTWYRRAAELGNIRAMHNLAVLYTRTGAKGPDYMSAKNWFHEAARHGLADSQFNLGILYESGLGPAKNLAEAYKWYSLAARQGDREARKRRELLRAKLSARALSPVEQTLKRWTAAKANQAANKTGQPRGGWQNAKTPGAAQVPGRQLIVQAQNLLNKLGYDAGLADGKLGPKTVAAIRRFETRSGIAKSGMVTPALLRKLEALDS